MQNGNVQLYSIPNEVSSGKVQKRGRGETEMTLVSIESLYLDGHSIKKKIVTAMRRPVGCMQIIIHSFWLRAYTSLFTPLSFSKASNNGMNAGRSACSPKKSTLNRIRVSHLLVSN